MIGFLVHSVFLIIAAVIFLLIFIGKVIKEHYENYKYKKEILHAIEITPRAQEYIKSNPELKKIFKESSKNDCIINRVSISHRDDLQTILQIKDDKCYRIHTFIVGQIETKVALYLRISPSFKDYFEQNKDNMQYFLYCADDSIEEYFSTSNNEIIYKHCWLQKTMFSSEPMTEILRFPIDNNLLDVEIQKHQKPKVNIETK